MVKTMTDLARHIQTAPLADTHEHLYSEMQYTENGPDVLQDLFDRLYIAADLVVAGAAPRAVERLLDASDPDLGSRWAGVAAAWEHCQHTGFGAAVRLTAQRVYGMDEISVPALEAAHARNLQLRRPGERLRILRDEANLAYVQVDSKSWACLPDVSGPEFFLYDLSWYLLSNGEIAFEDLQRATGIEVTGLARLREALAALFDSYAACAIAVKSQHAYRRTLLWTERGDDEAAQVLDKMLRGQPLPEAERLCLGDWCLARGVELSIEHNLPFKLHTGYNARYGEMWVDRIRPGNLCSLLQHYPQARFVLMHIGYPYADELAAVAKHYPNVFVDMCWSWSIDPRAASDFLRRMLHAVPVNKLFVFGGDTFWPNAAASFAAQARAWLARTLQAEVDEGLLTEREAVRFATRLMLTNQAECFAIDDKRAAIRATMSRQRSHDSPG